MKDCRDQSQCANILQRIRVEQDHVPRLFTILYRHAFSLAALEVLDMSTSPGSIPDSTINSALRRNPTNTSSLTTSIRPQPYLHVALIAALTAARDPSRRSQIVSILAGSVTSPLCQQELA